MILVKSHPKIPHKVCQSDGFGPSGPNSVRFGSILDMLFLRSNMHQNLWNSLVIMVMAWLWPIFHEIRRSIGGENHRYRPPTHPHSQTLLAPTNKVEKERSLVSWTQRMHKIYFQAFLIPWIPVANTFTFEYWSSEQLNGEHDSLPFLCTWRFCKIFKSRRHALISFNPLLVSHFVFEPH